MASRVERITIAPSVNGWVMIHRKSEIEHRKSEIDLAIGSPEVEAGVEGSIQSHLPSGKRQGYLLKSFCTQESFVF